MVFNSYTFILFLAAVLFLHYLPLPWRLKKFNLLWASYFFYAAWNPPFVALLWLSTIVDWFVAKRLYATERVHRRRLWLMASLAVNLGLLGFFKYGTFLSENFVHLLKVFGIHFSPVEMDIILPVGISFYTFQTLSYTLDIYRGKSPPWHSFLDYALYVTFFPQLVAGPIVRSTEFLPQCDFDHRANPKQISWGLVLLIVGLFQKVVVADGLLATIVERVYDADVTVDAWSSWAATLAFAGQIFCDFSGYSSCAIGVALCLGFHLPDNFRAPYAALGFSDFWSRWHISLSSWLRDYVYIPLGGNRSGSVRTYVNLAMTMLIGGIWHGAAWTFVFWGGLHGFYLIVERALRKRYPSICEPKSMAGRLGLSLTTFLLVCFAWVFFRADTFETAFSILAAMFGLGSLSGTGPLRHEDIVVALGTVFTLLAVHWGVREKPLEKLADWCPWWLVSAATAGMVFLIFTTPGNDRAFIYFQF